MKLTVIVICKNEEKLITACLESIKWADEIIVLDNGSIDQTKEIAKKYTDKVFSLEKEDFSSLRNKGMEKALGDWVLFLDADERVRMSLKQEILNCIQSDNCSALAISRENIIFGHKVKYGPYSKDWVVRLIKKPNFKEWVGKIHEYPKFDGKLAYSKNSFLHLTHRDVDQIVLKSLEWSKIDAKLRFDSSHPKMTGWRFLRILITELFNQGILRKGFFNGTIGVMDSVLQSFSMFLTYVRLWQIQQDKTLDETYKEIDKKLIEENFR